MFEGLTERLTGVFDRLRRRGTLSERDVEEALREIRIALLEADVALPVVKDFVREVRERAIGQEVIKSVTPAQMVVKIVHDRLVELLGGAHAELRLGNPPAVILMAGLQGSGKTTTTAKLARHLEKRGRKRVLVASLDVRRPAAQEQLATLARQAGVESLPIVPGEDALAITRRALERARRGGFDVLILDTAGRLHVDEELMAELEAVRRLAQPAEVLLVADALTGQVAVEVARTFDERIGITGVVLTRLDGDARGGAALSVRAVTGKPIKFVGVGEKLEDLQPFHPERMASRILDMGDVVSLVERAAETMEKEEAERLARRMAKGRFDLNDLRKQLDQVRRLGGMKGILAQLPGINRLKKQIDASRLDERLIVRQCAIIDSMTPEERRHPEIIHASRKRRIAAGSGTTVQEVNRLLKQHREMQKVLKRAKKAGGLDRLMGAMGTPPAGLPPGMRPH